MTGNQENKEKRQYLYFPDGREKAVLVHILKDGECPCNWEKITHHFTDGSKVYKRIVTN